MAIQNILEQQVYQAPCSSEEYLSRLAETEARFDHLTDALLVAGDVWRTSLGSRVFGSIDLGYYALQDTSVHLVAQPARRSMVRLHVPDRIKRSLTLKIPTDPDWVVGSREPLTAANSQHVGYVSINSAFQTATPRSMARLEDFRAVLDEVLLSL